MITCPLASRVRKGLPSLPSTVPKADVFELDVGAEKLHHREELLEVQALGGCRPHRARDRRGKWSLRCWTVAMSVVE